jgi:hypothetical protein
MRYAKPEIETVKLATHLIRSAFEKGFVLMFDNIWRFPTVTAYEADE